MSGLFIRCPEMPTTGLYYVGVDNTNGRDKTVVTVERMIGNRDARQIIGSYELVPVPDTGDLVRRDDVISDVRHYICEHCGDYFGPDATTESCDYCGAAMLIKAIKKTATGIHADKEESHE